MCIYIYRCLLIFTVIPAYLKDSNPLHRHESTSLDGGQQFNAYSLCIHYIQFIYNIYVHIYIMVHKHIYYRTILVH